MSSPITQSVSNVAAKATKTRKPTLPEKYGKFIQFAYYMMDNVLGEDFQIDKEAYLEKIKFFGSVEEQQILIQGFLTNAKEVNQTIKKMVTDRNKANKPVKQPRTKKSDASTSGDAVAEKLPKRARKPSAKKTVQTDEADLLNDLVQQLTLEPIPEPIVVLEDSEAIITENAKKPKKVAAKKSTKPPPPPPDEDYHTAMTNELLPETFVSEPEPPSVTTKPKRKTTKKESTNATVDAAILTDLKSIPNTDIEITPITFSGVTYFTDKDSQLYAYPVPSAKSIGKYVAETEEVFLN